MRYTTSGPIVESGVTRERINIYSTTLSSCGCPAYTYHRGDCKHIKAAKHGCDCPETLWFVEPSQGRSHLCAEALCECSAILRQALLNDGWVEIPDGILPRTLCFICEFEILPHTTAEDLPSLRYCHNGKHWLLPRCSYCETEVIALDAGGSPVCASCADGALLLVAV